MTARIRLGMLSTRLVTCSIGISSHAAFSHDLALSLMHKFSPTQPTAAEWIFRQIQLTTVFGAGTGKLWIARRVAEARVALCARPRYDSCRKQNSNVTWNLDIVLYLSSTGHGTFRLVLPPPHFFQVTQSPPKTTFEDEGSGRNWRKSHVPKVGLGASLRC